MTELEKLKKLTGETDEDLLSLLLEDAEKFVLSYTGRTKITDGLQKSVRDLAVIALNRMGTEGDASRSEAGESYSFDNAPPQIFSILNRYRIARVGGKTHEYKPADETESSGDTLPEAEGNEEG